MWFKEKGVFVCVCLCVCVRRRGGSEEAKKSLEGRLKRVCMCVCV